MEILAALKDTPIPTLLVLGGLIFLFLGIATIKKPIVIDVTPTSRKIALALGSVLVVTGLYLLSQPSLLPPQSADPTSPASTDLPTQILETGIPSGNPFGCKVWSDDFSQASRWGDEQVEWGSWGHENGEYKMSLYAPNYFSFRCILCSELYQQDFRIAVTARTPQNKGSWGIYFWGKENSSYTFELDKDGNALIKQYDNLNFAVLGSKQITMKATNDLRVEYINGSLSGYVNDSQEVIVPMESTPVLGNYGVGLTQASLSSDSAEVFFDDFSFSGCP